MATPYPEVAPMAAARSHFGAATHGGKIYVFGGGGDNFSSLSATEVYDPITDRWSACAPLPTPRSGIAAATIGDHIYVMGGGFRRPDGSFDFKSTVDVYDPQADRWQSGPPLAHRHDAPAALTVDGRVLLFGGHHPDAPGGPLTDPGFGECEGFTPGDEIWQALAPLPIPRFSLITVVRDGDVWAMGGGAFRNGTFANLDVIEHYQPADDAWRTDTLRLPWPAAGLHATMVREQLVVCGGNDEGTISDRVAVLDLGATAWRPLPALPEPRVMGVLMAIGDDPDDGLILAGGRGADAKTPTRTVYRMPTPHLAA